MIVVGIDGSEASTEALRLGLYEATLRGTRVRAVHAWSTVMPVAMASPVYVASVDPEPVRQAAEETLRRIVDAVAGERAASVERALIEGPADRAILENAHDAEMIVLGQRGLGAVGAMVLGSVSHHVVRHARCPVLIVPHPHD